MTDHATDSTVRRTAAASASLYFVLLFVVPPDGPPVETASSDQIRSYYTENASALHASALAAAAAGPAVIVFCAAIAQLVARRAAWSFWPPAMVAGGVLIAVWHWVTAAIEANIAVQGLDGTDLASVDDGVVAAWYAMTNVGHLFGDLAMSAIVLTLASMSWGCRHSEVLPAWLSWCGLSVAAAGAVGVVGVTLAVGPLANAWFIGLFGWTVWVPTVAILLLVRPLREVAGHEVHPEVHTG
ncbi:MAG TPA: hypothetical protein PLP61_02930 [Nocardioides sp.]|uniref:hypothetical protein n=1 Tax=Nocardioides sp. TaxID=35761 RepID=UPI002C81460E|nr:hypothetical protein [Nocardioides sp.]HQR25971.1 hypothetical protein [Nocardioides sp.]